MPPITQFATHTRDLLAPLGHVMLRRMFGTTALFCDGVLLGLIAHETLYLRTDDQTRPTFEQEAEAPPYTYTKQGKQIALAFWPTPTHLFDEPDALIAWARIALGAALRVAAKKKSKQSLFEKRDPKTFIR